MSFPARRLRRLRRTPTLRRLVAEARLTVDDLVAPVFVRDGIDAPAPVLSLPGVVQHTRDSLRSYVGGSLNCVSCHLEEGRRANAAPLVGVFARYPTYMLRSGAVVPIEDRVNYCFTRSLAGSKLPPDSREMQDIVAYLAYISRGVPNGEHVRYKTTAAILRF